MASRFPLQERVIVDQAVIEGHADFVNDFTEAVSQEPASGEAFVQRVMKIGKVIATMLKLIAWIWAAVTDDRAAHAQVVSRLDALEASAASRGVSKKVIRASDSKAVGSLRVFNSDRSEYKAWHAKLINVMAQLSENSRKVMSQ